MLLIIALKTESIESKLLTMAQRNVFYIKTKILRIRENIAYGREGVSRDEVERVCRAAGIHDFVMSLPDGYDTPLTRVFEENGIELSGGQWQKLSVARAFYKRSEILILDEPTASLDAIAEKEIFDRFTELSKNKLTVFVSHRLSSAIGAGNIVVLRDGKIVEHGTHRELMERQGDYHYLFTTQAERYGI